LSLQSQVAWVCIAHTHSLLGLSYIKERRTAKQNNGLNITEGTYRRALTTTDKEHMSQVKLLITNNAFCIVQRATAQSKTGIFVILV
jgi:hypothetical protein